MPTVCEYPKHFKNVFIYCRNKTYKRKTKKVVYSCQQKHKKSDRLKFILILTISFS